MRYISLVILITSAILVFQQISFVDYKIPNNATVKTCTTSYVNHDPIVIASNEDFVTQGFPGSGTPEIPFLIQGYNITTSEICISIQETNASFVISDCYLAGESTGNGAINCFNVTNGTIKNNIIKQSFAGIYLSSSFNNTIENNTITESNHGLWFSSSFNNTIENNTITDGIMFLQSSWNCIINNNLYGCELHIYSSSNYNQIKNNTITENYQGLFIGHSSNNTVCSNIFVNSGIIIISDDTTTSWHNITNDNLVNGKQVGYFWNLTSGNIDGSQYGQIILANCTEVSVENSDIDSTSAGIELLLSSYCTFSSNDVSRSGYGLLIENSFNTTIVNNNMDSNGIGILTENSSNATIKENEFFDNNDGIFLDYTTDSVVEDNTISNGLMNGVFVKNSFDNRIFDNTIFENDIGIRFLENSGECMIYNNILANNKNENAFDDGTDNHWNFTTYGNHWSDYSGSGVYTIPGSSGAIDYHPSMFNAPTLNSPPDLSYVVGSTGNNITWIAYSQHPSSYKLFRNGTELLSENWDGNTILVDVDGLDIGTYNYSIVVYDIYGLSAIDTVFVSVTQATTTTTTSGNTTGLTIILLGGGGIGVVAIVLILMKLRNR